MDLAELGVDLYGSPGQKWLCGPVGTGSLAVADHVERLEIGQPGYFSRDHQSEGPRSGPAPGGSTARRCRPRACSA